MSETDGLNPVELVLPVASGWAEGGYREYERSAFALVRAAMDGRLDITQTAAAMDGCTPEARNRIGTPSHRLESPVNLTLLDVTA